METPERICAVARRIESARARGERPIVVVSAMGQATDELIELAHRVSSHPSDREMDMLLTAGERISMALLGMALGDLGIPALSLTGSQSGIVTDSSHRHARIRKIIGTRVLSALEGGKVPIVAGFQGVSESKEITTLGRGGSDTTAVALAAALGARRCEIYTDVDGIFSANPAEIRGAKRYDAVDYSAMSCLAASGAQVLQARSVRLAANWEVELWVRNSMSENPGTRVTRLSDLERPRVQGISSDPSQGLWSFRPGRSTGLPELLAQGIPNADTFAWSVQGDRLNSFADRAFDSVIRAWIAETGGEGEVDPEMIPVTVVGHGIGSERSVLQAIARISVQLGARIHLVATQEIVIACPASRRLELVQTLHDALVLREESHG